MHRFRTQAAIARFYTQPFSEVRQLRQWEVDVLVSDMKRAADRG